MISIRPGEWRNAARCGLAACLAAAVASNARAEEAEPARQVIGATAEIEEVTSGVRMDARIDTGAKGCSVHAEEIRVEGGVPRMTKNIGKPISFVLIDASGERKRVESTIADTVRIKTAEDNERRYKIWLTLRHAGVERRVHVNLNDRSRMAYPMLIGRNFLRERFVVDVAIERSPLDPPAGGE